MTGLVVDVGVYVMQVEDFERRPRAGVDLLGVATIRLFGGTFFSLDLYLFKFGVFLNAMSFVSLYQMFDTEFYTHLSDFCLISG